MNTNIDPTAPEMIDLAEDQVPSDLLEAVNASEPEHDPTADPEFDDSPEALQALLDAEADAEDELGIESVQIPPVRWAEDRDQPDFAHSKTSAADGLQVPSVFEFGRDVFELLIRANQFEPNGKNGQVAFGLRGGKLLGNDRQEDVDTVQIEDTRPDHVGFNCTLGIFDTGTGKLSAYTGSTVPNTKWMQNYYKLKRGIHPHKSTRCNLLPSGCYIFRVNAHGGGKIKPALRMTNPDNLTQDAVCTVLRTHEDLAFSHDDFWDRSTPFDNIHCAYSDSSFSSAGCQTIKGPDGKGAWGAFQDRIGALGWNARIDYVLITGRDAAIAAAILAAGRQDDEALVRAALGRLRVGSRGDAVTALQKKLGFNGTGYFGPSTRKRLVEAEASRGLASDGIYSPADDMTTGWAVFGQAVPVVAPVEPAVVLTTPPVATEPVSPTSDGDTGLRMRLVGSPVGSALWDDAGRNDQIRLRPADGAQSMTFAAKVVLETGQTDLPLSVEAAIDGAPPSSSGVTLEVTVTAKPTGDGEIPADPATEPAVTTSLTTPAPPVLQPTGAVAITGDDIDTFAPRARSDYRAALIEKSASVLGPHGIDATPRRLSHFLAQIGHESGGFSLRIESLNYTSAERLMKIWPSRFPTVSAAQPFVRNEPALADKVYGGRLGNNRPGDGFRYRGRGLIQLTGRDTYQEYSDKLGVDLVGNPDLAFEPVTALRIAAEYWAGRKLRGERPMNALADNDKLRALTYRINGGFTNFAHREEELARAKAIWGDTDAHEGASQVVERGDFNDMVRKLQLLLVENGYLRGTVDGKFGFGTYKALRKFKTEAGLDGVGYADPETFRALRDGDSIGIESVESDEPVPVIGEEPETIREGISLAAPEELTS